MSSNLFCNLNGNLILNSESLYRSSDDDFRLRYGLYETYLFQNGQLEYANLHWIRLLSGMHLLGFPIPDMYSEIFFTKQITELIHRNNLSDFTRIRLQIFTENKEPPFTPQYLIESLAIDLSTIEWKEEGINIGILKGFRKEIDATSNCKISLNKHFLLARTAMEEYNFDDVLLLNEKGNIAESAIANVFWVKNNVVYTPPLSEGCLAGTIRAVIIDQIKATGISFEERLMTLEDLKTADEIFLTNSIRKIRWVREIEGRGYNNLIVKKLNENLSPEVSSGNEYRADYRNYLKKKYL